MRKFLIFLISLPFLFVCLFFTFMCILVTPLLGTIWGLMIVIDRLKGKPWDFGVFPFMWSIGVLMYLEITGFCPELQKRLDRLI